VLRLVAVTHQTLLRFETAMLSGFGLFFHASCGWAMGNSYALPWIVRARVQDTLSCQGERRASCTSRATPFLLSFVGPFMVHLCPDSILPSSHGPLRTGAHTEGRR
jgi:hypothetical protein